jgi:Transposase IS66 family
LISDFYASYDTVDCMQQKYLVHLLRDINDDVLKQPFNEEMVELARDFTNLLKPMIDTIDRFGLKARYLRRHKKEVHRFYKNLSKRCYITESATAYKSRFEKNAGKLFTFLDHDNVPWNNNNAEHAIKAFVHIRRSIGAKSTAKGVREYLILLSLRETCKYKDVDFLRYLRSGETDIDYFVRHS